MVMCRRKTGPSVMLAAFTSATSTISEKLVSGMPPKEVDAIRKEKDAELEKWQKQWDSHGSKGTESVKST